MENLIGIGYLSFLGRFFGFFIFRLENIVFVFGGVLVWRCFRCKGFI